MTDRKEYIERGAVERMLENAQIISDGEYSGYCTEDISLDEIPAADVVEVVRCRDCKKRYVPAYCALWYGQINDEHGCRDIFLRAHNDDFYCAYGERKDSADDE